MIRCRGLNAIGQQGETRARNSALGPDGAATSIGGVTTSGPPPGEPSSCVVLVDMGRGLVLTTLEAYRGQSVPLVFGYIAALTG